MLALFEDLEKYKSLDFFARQIVEGFITGLHKSPFHGFSVEFAEHRLYNSGESTKNIDWKLYGRTDKLFVKRFAEETNLRCHIVVDHSRSMLFPLEGHGRLQQPNKLTFAIYAAAVLVELLVRQRDAFGLSLVSDKIDLQTETRSSTLHQHHVLHLLADELQRTPAPAADVPASSTLLATNLHLLAEQLHRRSVVVIFTDAIVSDAEREALFDALRHLRHCKHEVLLFHTLDRAHELLFDYSNRPTLFIDLESGQRLKVNPSEVADHYRQLMQLSTAELKRHAMQYHIDYQPVHVDEGFHNVILPFLLKRARHF